MKLIPIYFKSNTIQRKVKKKKKKKKKKKN